MGDYFKEIAKFYRSSAPIENPDFFVGRLNEKTLLYKTLVLPGRHGIIYGIRGIGKTSLINVTTQIFTIENKCEIVHHSCSFTDNFSSIAFSILNNCKLNIENKEEKNTYSGELSAEFHLPFISKSSSKGNYEKETTKAKILETQLSPSFFTNILHPHNLIIILDEFDRISGQETISQIAETMKMLSDKSSKTKIIIAGVANSSDAFLVEHLSLNRHLVNIEVPLMPDSEIIDIIKFGEKKLGITFDENIIKIIVWLSDGLPYFAHLLSEELVINALLKKQKHINNSNLKDIISDIFKVRSYEIIKYDYNLIITSEKNKHIFLDPITDDKIYGYSTILKKIVLLAFSIVESKVENKLKMTLENIHNYFPQLFEVQDRKTFSETEINDILESFSMRKKFITYSDDVGYGFIDNFHKTYVRLKAIEDLDHKYLSEIITCC